MSRAPWEIHHLNLTWNATVDYASPTDMQTHVAGLVILSRLVTVASLCSQITTKSLLLLDAHQN